MEHKLITGGEQYLPFARSRIKALRAAGLKYASQKFEIDGCSIKVRIEPGNEYIELEGGSDTLLMDSGIVDVGITNEEDQARYLPGGLVKPAHVDSYDAAFTKESKTPWWVNPGKMSVGQLSGELSAGGYFTGKIRKDGVAKSFTPRSMMQGAPPVMGPDPADQMLVDKKRTSDLCPPSMFTGRARLYAQALFGQYLGSGVMVGDVEQDNSPPTLIQGGPPSLRLSTYGDRDTERVAVFKEKNAAAKTAAEAAGYGLVYLDPYNVTLNINSGVYLDPVSGNHWLMNPTVGRVTVYPLVSSRSGEALRRWLRPAMGEKLSAEDRYHLEAYILSACRPHVELAQVLDISTNINPYSMGYGWHWNWSGTQADMVQNLATNTPFSGGTSSTHYRLSVHPVYDVGRRATQWSAGASVVEGPVVWSTVRPCCCITEPSWADRSTTGSFPVYWSVKTASGLSPLFECNAPFYAFYRGDELQVCRSRVVKESKTDPTLEFSAGYVTRVAPGDPTNLSYIFEGATLGNQAGFVRASAGVNEHWVLTLSCGSTAVTVTHGKYEALTFDTSAAKNDLGPQGIDGGAQFGPGGYDFLTGYPLADGAWETVTVAPGYWSAERYHLSTFDRVGGNEARTSPGVAGAIIPFYDAEACYLLQDTQDEDLKTLQHSQKVGGTYVTERHGVAAHWDPYPNLVLDGPVGPYVRYVWNTPSTTILPTHSIPDELSVSNHIVSVYALYKGGAASAKEIPSDAMGLFADPLSDYVESTFKTLSSASPSAPLLRGLLDVGWPTKNIGRPAIVGWV